MKNVEELNGDVDNLPRILRENSIESNVSEMSISDLSMQEHGSETLTYLESLQSEVNTLIDNCEKIDEDFELVKSSRITPGMAALLKCCQPNDSGQDSPTTSARAKACFTGLYSLTYSPSLDLSDDKTHAPADSSEDKSLELDSSLLSEEVNQSLPLSSTHTDSTLAASEDEVMSKLEWDLLDMEPVKEEETEIDSTSADV
ncbi:hypothetical protein B566_EDAN015047 [Ephemera danica]|nr:hypothetical protein B566_EDAN015047 [Ephemera danica]